jgi:ribose-phosphate pyrophosphokinase
MIRIGNTIIEQGHFPDNSLMLKITPNGENAVITWNYESDIELFTLICIVKHFDPIRFRLYMPYCPHARMDRVVNPEDVFTLKYFAEVINSLNFESVIIEDPHSNVCTALINHSIAVFPGLYIQETVNQINDPNLVFCYPDEGAMKRYSSAIKAPYVYGNKNRDWETGEIKGLTLINEELVKGKNVLIIDDICSRGGTFYHTAKALKEAGAEKIYLYITHCEMTIFNGEIFSSGLIDHVYTTNSIFPNNAQNEQISIVTPQLPQKTEENAEE